MEQAPHGFGLGCDGQAGVSVVRTGAPTWTGAVPVLPFSAQVQLRAHGVPVTCEVRAEERGGLVLELAEEQRGVAPGQSAVLYEPDPARGDRVMGQGRIEASGDRGEPTRH